MEGRLQSYFLNERLKQSMYTKKNAINGHGRRILSFGKAGIEHISAQNPHFDLKKKVSLVRIPSHGQSLRGVSNEC
jgi:hypothetical protein